MTSYRIHLLGGVSILPKGTSEGIDLPGKSLELVIYLLLNAQKLHLRDHLATQLWPDVTPVHSRKYFRQALWQIQSRMNNGGAASIILSEPQWVRLNPDFPIWSDVDQVVQAFNSVQNLPGSDLSSEQFAALQQATALYRGDLLPGWYHNWCLVERERLRSVFLAMMDKMIDYCQVTHDYEQGIQYALKMLHHDISREKTHRRLMLLYYLSGDRSSALRHYRQCETILAQELQVSPTSATRQLFEEILHEKLPVELPIPAVNPAAPLAHNILAELEWIKTSLLAIQQEINQLKPCQ
jgi:DNA-binding SARP family transcriptional activator